MGQKNVKRFILITAILIFLLIAAAGCVSVDAGDPQYRNGNLTTIIEYHGDTRDVWVQNTVYKLDGFNSEKIDTVMLAYTFSEGPQICELPFDLMPGSYKVNIYVLGRDENSDRIAAFIRNFEVV